MMLLADWSALWQALILLLSAPKVFCYLAAQLTPASDLF